MKPFGQIGAFLSAACILLALLATVKAQPQPPDDPGAIAAFNAIVPVLHNSRCINCHSVGDFPRVGDDRRPHFMNVKRGRTGHGVNGVLCSTCHQDHNLAGIHMPPGAPGWGLPPQREPLIWEGLSPHELCELFKDPARNGHRNLTQIINHMQTPLISWGWAPGEGRAPIPMPRDEFLGHVKDWVAKGGACPAV